MKAILDLLLPPVCLACHSRIPSSGEVICQTCSKLVGVISESFCPKCGSPLEQESCQACSEHDYSFDFCRAVYRYGDVIQSLIHDLKYHRRSSVGKYFGLAMGEYASSSELYQGFDYVVPVPLHPVRRRERGYNQSRIMASVMARRLGLPCKELVRRKVYTASQTNLGKTEREANLKGAFAVSEQKVQGKKLILVDDVFTTGTTVDVISKLLNEKGAARVAVLTAARA